MKQTKQLFLILVMLFCSATAYCDEIITFADTNVEAICVAHWDTNGDGKLSKEEASAVTDLDNVFCNNEEITSFNELQFFTGLNKIGMDDFSECTNLKSVIIPTNVTEIDGGRVLGIYHGAFKKCDNLSNISIPNSVITIGSYAFYGCNSLSSVTIQNGSIESWAFYGCSSLVTLIIGNGVTEIGYNAFSGCSNLPSVTIGNGITSIGGDAFAGCESLTKVCISDIEAWCKIVFDSSRDHPYSNPLNKAHHLFLNGEEVVDLVIPDCITKINSSAFHGCDGLVSVKIPNSVTMIDDYAFYGCNGLKSLTIPNSVTIIGWSAFSECRNLTSLSLSNTLTTIRESAFQLCRNLTSLIIPSSVTSIGEKAFADCYKLNSIKSEITNPFEIGPYTFKFYDSTKPNYIYDNVSLIVPTGTKEKYKTVSDWKKFKNIIEEDSDSEPKILNVGDTFESSIDGVLCYFMVIDGNHITLLKDSELSGNVEIPETITYNGVEYIITGIGDNAFTNCTTLTSLTIPATVTTIGEAALAGCTGLTAFIIADGNQSFTVEDGVLYDKEKTTLVACPAGKSGTVTIPGTVATIEANGFYNCSKLTSIELPSSLKRIKDAAFVGCSSLTTMNIPASMNRYSIGLGAFTGCTNMESFTVSEGCKGYAAKDGVLYLLDPMGLGTLSELVAYPNKRGDTYTVPSTVGMINSYAFCMTDIRELTLPYMSQVANYAVAYCHKLEKVTSTAAVPGWNNFATAFTGSLDTATLYVPFGSKALYQATEGWKEFGDKIVEAGGDGDTYFVDGANNFYKITGSETVALVGINEGVENLSIPASASYNGKNYVVTDVGSGEEELSIVRFSLPKVKEINIPASVTKIGDWAFYQSLWKISTVEIPNTVKEIGNWAFSLNDHLESLTLNEGLEKIGEGAFSGCYNLRKVDIPSGVTSIGSSAFSSVDESVTIPATVKFIGRYAFQGYSPEKSLRVNISDLDAWCRIESDGGYWEEPVRFYNLYKDDSEVTEIVIPDGMTSISKVFHSCSNLSKVTIPSTVTDVNCAFYWCKNLQSVVNFSTAPQPIELYYVNSGTRGDDSVESFHTAFQFVEKNKCTLYVPRGSIITYSQAEGWRDFKNILEINGSAISCTVLDGEPFAVYSLQGHKILSGVTSLKGLPKGIYIVNGRKVIWQ